MCLSVPGLYVDVPNPDTRGLGGGDGRDNDQDYEGNQGRNSARRRHLLHPLPSLRHSGAYTVLNLHASNDIKKIKKSIISGLFFCTFFSTSELLS